MFIKIIIGHFFNMKGYSIITSKPEYLSLPVAKFIL